jgi:repressor LexA
MNKDMPPVVYRKQRQIIDFLRQYIKANGVAPTLRQIANAIGVKSLATVHEHLEALKEKGLIKKTVGAVRGLELTEEVRDESEGLTLPILGYIAAGTPIEPHTDPNANLMVNPELISGKKPAFALQVRGNSMIEDGILDGDYVICEQQEMADNGDVVVALLSNGFATLKRFFKENGKIRLQPANAEMKPIFTTKVKIQGKVVALVRKF